MKSLLHSLNHLLPANLDQPIQVSFEHQGKKVSLTVTPDQIKTATAEAPMRPTEIPENGPSDMETTESLLRQLALAEQIDDDNENGKTEEVQLRRRMLMQRLADRAREETKQERLRAGENKRVASKMQDLQERMRIKRANLSKACHATTTMLPSGLPAPIQTVGSEKKSFAGLRPGFLARSSAILSPTSKATIVAATTPTPLISSPTTSMLTSPDCGSEQKETVGNDVGCVNEKNLQNKKTFGGLRPGFLQQPSRKA